MEKMRFIVPLIHITNIFSFTLGLTLYLVGFWGMVISFFTAPENIVRFLIAYCVGLASCVLSGYLTHYECSFHNHTISHTCP